MGSNHKRSFRWLSQLTCLICWALVGLPAQAQGTQPVEVRVAPATLQVAVNQTANVAVEVRDVTGLYGADIALSFDPTAVEIIDADANTAGVQVALGTFLDAGFTIRNTADNTAGTVRFALTQLNPSEAKNGSGVLIVILLRGKQIGMHTPLTLTSVQLAQRDGAKLATTLVSGQIEVVATAAGPTSTPITTQAPGTTMPTATRTVPPAARTPTSEASPAEAPTATRRSPTSASPAVATPVPSNPPGDATAGQAKLTATATAVLGRLTTGTSAPTPPAALPDAQVTPAATMPVAKTTPLVSATPQQSAASGTMAAVKPPLPTQSGETAGAKLLPDGRMTPAAAASAAGPTQPGRTFLLTGVGLLGLATVLLVFGTVFFVVRRGRLSQQTPRER